MSDLAQRIRAARDKMGVSIEEAERATKIRRRYIEAIEAGDFDRLPDGPPSRGFIKNYARYLGMDPDQSLTDFEAEVGVPILQLNESVPPPPTRQQAVSRYTQLVKLPQVRWKGELPASDEAELDMLADNENGNESHALPQDQQGSNGRMVLRRTEVPPSPPNSFSLREPKVAQTSDVRPFQMGRSPFSLRNPDRAAQQSGCRSTVSHFTDVDERAGTYAHVPDVRCSGGWACGGGGADLAGASACDTRRFVSCRPRADPGHQHCIYRRISSTHRNVIDGDQ